MKYYTQCQRPEQELPFTFKVWMDYEEAVTNAQALLKMCDLPHIDIVEHTTNKIFITFHKFKNDIQDERKTARKKQKCEVF